MGYEAFIMHIDRNVSMS